jgi:uncharacterized protein YdhG (YjbR/CyaY superfamily)
VDEYIEALSPPVRRTLLQLRKIIKSAAPEAEEVISYQMPAYKYYGMLVYFAAWKTHIGFYPAGKLDTFEKELSAYERTKGTIKFTIDKPLPFGLISKIVKYKVKVNEAKKKAKK